MREVVALGVGMTPFGVSEKTCVELFASAAWEAVQDAGIGTKDIEALFLGNVFGDFEEGQAVMASFAAAQLGIPHIPATRFEGACASGAVAVRDAYMLVASGQYDLVLAGGTERCTVMGTSLATRTFAMGSDSRYESPTGITFPGVFGMIAHMYADKYALPLSRLKEHMAMVAVKNHKNGCFNEKAQFRKEITPEHVLNSAMIADPLQLFDCCPFSDGAAAVVLTTLEKAKKMTEKPVIIAGAGQASAGNLGDQRDLTLVQARRISSKKAYEMAGIGPEEIDVCELHDCFTIAEIVATEGLGFFNDGEGSYAAQEGKTGLQGTIPINPSGGLKAKGHPIGATGAAQVYEIVKQLKGECGDRQVENARIGITDTLGGDLCTIVNLILKRGW